MKLTNIMPDEGYCIAVWVDGRGDIKSEMWQIHNDGIIEYWDDQLGWSVVDLGSKFYSGLEIKFAVLER